jgi:hypothetical protein
LPPTQETKRAIAKYVIAKSAESLLDEELVGMLSIVNTKREKKNKVTIVEDDEE